MKKLLISSLVLLSLLSLKASAEEYSAEALLHQMNSASQQLNYELSYILVKKNTIEPLLYRHATVEDNRYAQLTYLSGQVREVIRRNDEVSYVDPGREPFTIESGSMVAPLMPMLDTDIAALSQYYDFVLMGRAREAGSASQVVRVVPKDGQRYSYLVWIDEKSKLPLRTDLVDREGEVLEQYRAISYTVSERVARHLAQLDSITLPAVLSFPKQEQTTSFWNANWIPEGFEAHSSNRYPMAVTNKVVETKMYSDGLFSFSIYVAEKDEESPANQLVRQGRRTLHSKIKNNKEITLVGDIPPSTAKKIVESIAFTQQVEIDNMTEAAKEEQPAEPSN